MRTLIIGAGLCGLWVARGLRDAGAVGDEVVVLEKSRGVGGRLATRRTERARFDHGAQYYALKPPLALAHERWQREGLVTHWFDKDGVAAFAAARGMTSLAKDLAADLDVRLSERAVRIEADGTKWMIHAESGTSWTADVVVLTSPLPQALELLTASGIAFDVTLSTVRYAMSLVALYEGGEIRSDTGYLDHTDADVQSIADQVSKRVSDVPAWTVTMSPEFSARHFDEDEATILDRIAAVIRRRDPEFAFTRVELKKWRYAQPSNCVGGGFARVADGLFLAGDAFARPSLNGAVSSADALLSAWPGIT